jgi:hypothetical protein
MPARKIASTLLLGVVLLAVALSFLILAPPSRPVLLLPNSSNNNNNKDNSRHPPTSSLRLPQSAAAPLSHLATSTTTLALPALQTLYGRLLGPDEYGTTNCPKTCGCPKTTVDCPRHYDVADLQLGATARPDAAADHHYLALLAARHTESQTACTNSNVAGHGGWCLGKRAKSGEHMTLPGGGVSIAIPRGHVGASERIGLTLEALFRRENVTSVSDFGAGVGQYGAYLVPRLGPRFTYRAYDGAGDIESYTNGFVKYADFTLPLPQLPVTDWVLSTEVGEHIPSQFEGMFLRNLHATNCRGVVLSWAVLGQGGEQHINNHSNDYVAAVFTDLGYTRDLELEAQLRMGDKNHWWLEASAMAFRRNTAVC